ncbi:peptidylprolyl isomerase [Proteinivorax hydrogeniformans]|uniref:Peptidyl-prolyl cis-trans isomerase n=1 Tax=Proteinivorax hydrogeniformans TaxID=1826727 RepID=A0AAU8HUN5_9FIRM
MKKYTLIIALFAVLMIVGCSSNDPEDTAQEILEGDNPKVQIEMEDGGKMVLELYPAHAPKTVENFLELALSGFYDGLTFHRIIEGFMIQGGDPNGDGTGGAQRTITGEFADNGFTQNTLNHTKGVISMARSHDPNSASSQFFIVHGDEVPHLDGGYAAFGKLIEGEETLDNIAGTKADQNDVVIKSITVLKNN